jgi:site-specific DNA-cytosine methylase
MNATADILVRIKHFHLFCGLGGGKKGFNRGQARVGHLVAKFECLGGIDVDPAGIRDFNNAGPGEGTVMDLFSLEQYIAFWGRPPPAGWREATIDDVRRAARYQNPDIAFLSAPCKGFSGLLPEASSKTAKYQALNALTLRGVWLMLEAFKDDPVSLYVFENVPRIQNRGRHLLDEICALFRAYGYVVAETTHDCGKLGGLGQSRKRFLLVARHEKKVPPFLYEPPQKRLRGVGEILERLPLPGDERGGPMHRMPALQWKTWVRLAFVEAGSDWRSLNNLNVADGVLTDFGIVPDRPMHNGTLGVTAWGESTGVVTSRGLPNNGNFAVADPRMPEESTEFKGGRVVDWEKSAGAITTQRSPGSSAQSVADPRIEGHEKSVQLGVGRWDQPAAVVTGDVSVGTGRYAIPDPRIEGKPRFNNTYRIVPWGAPSPAVAGPGGPAGGVAVSDPRIARSADEAAAIADPRTGYGSKAQPNFRTFGWDETAGAVTGADHVTGAAASVADPRVDWNENAHASKLAVQAWEQPGRTIGGARFGSGGGAVADPRPSQRDDYKQTKYRVTSMDEPSGAVIAASTTGNGAFAVADPRPNLTDDTTRYRETSGHYGVVRMEQTSRAVVGFAKHDNGPWSVADPRGKHLGQFNEDVNPIILPAANERLVCVIRALDNTWHRPFTTLELAALQSLVDPEDLGFTLDGQSDSAWRERIGNAVPPDAAQAIASVMGTTLLLARSGQTFVLSSEPIWVRPFMVALSVDHSANRGLLD